MSKDQKSARSDPGAGAGQCGDANVRQPHNNMQSGDLSSRPHLHEPYDPELIDQVLVWAGLQAGEPKQVCQGGNMTAAKDLRDVARQAQALAGQAGMLAEACEAAQDPDGRWFWLRRRAKHLAIYWTATHPQAAPLESAL